MVGPIVALSKRQRLVLGLLLAVLGLTQTPRPGDAQLPSLAAFALTHAGTLGTTDMPWLRAGLYLNQPLGLGADRDGVWVANAGGRHVLRLGVGAIEELGRSGSLQALYGLPARWITDVAVAVAAATSWATATPTATPDPDAGVALPPPRRVWLVDQGAHVVVSIPLDARGNAGTPTLIGEHDVPGSDNAHFQDPTGIAVAANGTLFVADTGNHRIQVLASNGRHLATLGTTGQAGNTATTFNGPTRLTLGSDGRLYVADTGNRRLQSFDIRVPTAPTWVQTFDGGASAAFANPVGVAVDATFLYVADGAAGRVLVLRKSDGRLQQTLDGSSREACALADGGERWSAVGDVAIDAGGFLYVSLPAGMQVLRCDAFDRHRTNAYGAPRLPYPTELGLHNGPAAVAVAPDGTVLVAEMDGQRVVARPAGSGAGWAYGQPGIAGTGGGYLDTPSDVLRLDDGRWLVADAGNGRLVVLEGDGRPAAVWGAGSLRRPEGLALLAGGRLAVADALTGRVHLLDSATGAVVAVLSDATGQAIPFRAPADVAVDGVGTWYVSDRVEHTVRVLDARGQALRTLGESGQRGTDFAHFDTPRGLAVDAMGRLYVADSGNHRVQVFAADGSYLTTIGGVAGTGTGGLREPRGVALAPDGGLAVADTYNHRVQLFAPAAEPWLPAATNGFGDPRAGAITSLAELDGRLYAGTWDTRGARVWRRGAVDDWAPVSPPGFGDPGTVAVQDLVTYRDALYAGVEHRAFTTLPGQPPQPVSKGAEIWRSVAGTVWERVADGGFGQERLSGIGAFAEFQGQLYAGTRAMDTRTELTLWRSPSGAAGSWRKLDVEAGRHDLWSQNSAISAMAVFSGTLFLGTCGEPRPQLWSSGTGQRWQGVGSGRDLPELPLSEGSARCVTTLTEFDGWLYAGVGVDDSPLASTRRPTPVELLRCRRCDGSDWELAAAPGLGRPGNTGPVALLPFDEPPFRYFYLAVGNPAEGAEVWRAADGVDWEPVAVGGFGDDHNVAVGGGRAMGVYQGRLLVGTLNKAHGGELWSTAGTRPLTLPTPPGPSVTATPRPSPQPPTGRARYEKVGEWPLGSAAAPDLMGQVVDLDSGDDGMVYLLDANPARVLRLTSAGAWADPFGGVGSGPSRVTRVLGDDNGATGAIAVDAAAQRIYVSDLGTERIVIFDLAGRYLDSIPEAYPVDLAVRPDGTLWVADLLAGAVRRLTPDGRELERVLSYGPDVDRQARGLVAVVEDPGGRLWVADLGGDRLRAFERDAGGWQRTRTMDMRRRVLETCSARRLQALADNTLLAGACILTAGRVTRYLPTDYRGSDLYGVALRTVTRDGRALALAGRDTEPDDPDSPLLPVVVHFADADFSRVVASWAGRRFEVGTAPPDAILGPHRLGVAPNGDVFVQDALGHRRFSPSGQPLDVLPTSLYPSRHARMTLDARLTIGTGRPGQVVGLGHYTYGRAGDAQVVALANALQRRHCAAGRCSLGLYLDMVWDSTISRELNEYLYAAAFEPSREQYVLLQLFRDNPGHVEFPARLYIFPLAFAGRKTEVVLPDKDRAALWTDVDAGPDGRIYALDTLGDRLLVLDAGGAELGFVATPKDAWKVAGGPNGEAYVLTTYGHVVRLAADGTVLSRFVGLPNALAPGTALKDLAVDAWGRVYVLDELYQQVTVFEPTGREEDVLVGKGCNLAGDKWVAPGDILLGDTAELTLRLFGSCGYDEEPSDIVLALGVPGGESTHEHLRVGRQILSLVDLDRHRLAFVPYAQSAELDTRLTQDRTALIRALFDVNVGRTVSCGPNPLAAMRVARDAFADTPAGRRKVLILAYGGTEAGPGACPWTLDQVAAAAGELKAAGVTIVTVNQQTAPSIAAASELLGSNTVAARGQGEARAVLRRTLNRVWPDSVLRTGTLTDTLPANIDYVPGSAHPPAAWDAATRTLTWALTDLARAAAHDFSLRIRPRVEGLWPTNFEAAAAGTDGWGHPMVAVLPVPRIRVYGALPPTASPTLTRTLTPSPTLTPGPTMTPRPTRPPVPIYLPILLRTEACQPDTRNADVALVIDTSGSMGEATRPGGPTKLAAAVEAARAFLGQLKGGRDQAALIQFHSDATVVVGLTGNIAAVTAGLAGLTQATGTRIDLALDTAAAQLTGPARRAGNNPVVILLTDGEPTGTTPEVVRAAARRARTAGLLVFTVGLGQAVDHTLLQDVATVPAWYYVAPDTDDLAGIYATIAYTLPCRPAWP